MPGPSVTNNCSQGPYTDESELVDPDSFGTCDFDPLGFSGVNKALEKDKVVNDMTVNITLGKLSIGDTTTQLEGECWRSPERPGKRGPGDKVKKRLRKLRKINSSFSINYFYT